MRQSWETFELLDVPWILLERYLKRLEFFIGRLRRWIEWWRCRVKLIFSRRNIINVFYKLARHDTDWSEFQHQIPIGQLFYLINFYHDYCIVSSRIIHNRQKWYLCFSGVLLSCIRKNSCTWPTHYPYYFCSLQIVDISLHHKWIRKNN